MRDADDDFMDFDNEPRFPITVAVAGSIWICIGGLALASLVLSVALWAGGRPPSRPTRSGVDVNSPAYQTGRVGGSVCTGLLAVGFLFLGIQSVRGAIRHPLGTSIVSIILGACNLLLAGLLVLTRELLPAGVIALLAVGLLAGGILSLMGRNDYIAWRKALRRRQREEEV